MEDKDDFDDKKENNIKINKYELIKIILSSFFSIVGILMAFLNITIVLTLIPIFIGLILLTWLISDLRGDIWKKFLIGVVLLVLLGSVLFLGYCSNDKNIMRNNDNSYSSENLNNSVTTATNLDTNNANADYKIVIEYDGPFTGGFGTEFHNEDITSDTYYEFDAGNTSFINVGAKKSDGSNEKLTLSIMNKDKIVEQKSTTDPYGEILINFKE